MAEANELLTVNQVASLLMVTPDTIKRWIRDKRLVASMPGGTRVGYRIRMADLQRFIDDNRV